MGPTSCGRKGWSEQSGVCREQHMHHCHKNKTTSSHLLRYVLPFLFTISCTFVFIHGANKTWGGKSELNLFSIVPPLFGSFKLVNGHPTYHLQAWISPFYSFPLNSWLFLVPFFLCCLCVSILLGLWFVGETDAGLTPVLLAQYLERKSNKYAMRFQSQQNWILLRRKDFLCMVFLFLFFVFFYSKKGRYISGCVCTHG